MTSLCFLAVAIFGLFSLSKLPVDLYPDIETILGIEVGGNEQIIKGLHTIGLEAVILTIGGTLGSVIAAWALWRALYKRKGGQA